MGARGAHIAAQKGIIICNSAGNSGDEPWHFIGVPSDAVGVIAVGAVDSQTGAHASFSSYGPSADGRIKPDLSAPGANVITAGNVGYDLTMSAGTSIASPILAGSFAALWSAVPYKNAREITDAVFSTANQRDNPDAKLGYGVPDFGRAWLQLQGITIRGNGYWYGFDAATHTLRILLFDPPLVTRSMATIQSILGQYSACIEVVSQGRAYQLLEMTLPEYLPQGAYMLQWEKQFFLIGL